MRKLLSLILCFVFLCLPVYATYYPIPANKSTQYKAEIEAVIKREAPNIRRNMDKVVSDYNRETNEERKYTIRSIGLDSTLFDLYVKI